MNGRARRVGVAAGWLALRAALLVVAAALAMELAVRTGSVSRADFAPLPESVRLVDRDGRPLREAVGEGGARLHWTPLERISPEVVRATLAVEDARFYQHDGVDRRAVARALWQDVTAMSVVSGASTITMQLASLVWSHERSLLGKAREMVVARRIERVLGKDEILEQYLNRAPYGGGTIGVEAASQRYFGKPNTHLSLAQAALIAGLPKAPAVLDPLRNPEGAQRRQRHVLARMRAVGMIDEARHQQALAEPLAYVEARPEPAALHFTDMVLGAVHGGAPGSLPGWMTRAVAPRGGEIVTTLDGALQAEVEDMVATHVRMLAEGGVGNAAVVVLDNRRCDVLAMVGSADYWDAEGGAVNGALARRQPGSTLKPFTYALAFEAGYSPASVIPDVETRYGGGDRELFVPRNYDGRFSGPVSMAESLARSLNVPALRVAERVGVDALLGRLRALGMQSLDRDAAHYGLGLTLGNGEVTLLELTGAYAALARGGVSCTPRARVDEPVAAGARVFSEQVAFLVTDVLANERLRMAAFGPNNALVMGAPVAIKTGTSANFRDNWTVGYTERYTVGVWAGNFDGASMNHLPGATGAGPLFHGVMKAVLARSGGPPAALPPAPDGVVHAEVCALSGQRPGPRCRHRRAVAVRRAHAPDEPCSWHREVAFDRRNGLRAGPHCPAEHVARRVVTDLPEAYRAWQLEHDPGARLPPYSPLCPARGAAAGSLAIESPREGEVFVIEPGYDRATQTIALVASASDAVGAVQWRIDGVPIARAGWPYRASWRLRKGVHTLEVSAPGLRPDQVRFEVR